MRLRFVENGTQWQEMAGNGRKWQTFCGGYPVWCHIVLRHSSGVLPEQALPSDWSGAMAHGLEIRCPNTIPDSGIILKRVDDSTT